MKKLFFNIAVILSLCVTANAQSFDTNQKKEMELKSISVRLQALREHALAKGLADGRRNRFNAIHNYLDQNKRTFDTIYQVDHLYMQPRRAKVKKEWNNKDTLVKEDLNQFNGFLIQPPIVLKGTDVLQLSDNGQSKEGASIRYAIASNAQFVSSPLYWQTFLVSLEDVVDSGPPDDPMLQPRDKIEADSMQQLYSVGFIEGSSQADQEFETRLKTLTTMINGMMLGRTLMDKNILTEPEVTTQYIPVSGNNTQLTLNNNVATISVPSAFERDATKYKAIIHQANPLAKE